MSHPYQGSTTERRSAGTITIPVYLPTNRIAEAADGALKEQRIAAVLDKGGHLSRRGDKTRIAIRWVPKIGRVDCYALWRSKFGRTDKDTDRDELRVVAGDG